MGKEYRILKEMATTKRMFSNDIVGSDAFLEMPSTTQSLYFHLGMRCDDDGFVNPNVTMRMTGANKNDLDILIAKRFLLPFKNGVVVIKHHRINNNWDARDCRRTLYTEEFRLLFIKENNSYTLDNEKGDSVLMKYPKTDRKIKELLPTTETRRKPDGNPTTEEKRREENRIEETKLPNWLDKKTWEDWVKYKKELGKTLKPSTIKLQLALLEKNQKDHIQIIKNSIANGWIGLFEIKPMTKGGNSDYARAYDKKIQQDREELERKENERENDRFRKISEQSRALANKFDPNK
jgi:hypothetical protein